MPISGFSPLFFTITSYSFPTKCCQNSSSNHHLHLHLIQFSHFSLHPSSTRLQHSSCLNHPVKTPALWSWMSKHPPLLAELLSQAHQPLPPHQSLSRLRLQHCTRSPSRRSARWHRLCLPESQTKPATTRTRLLSHKS